MDTPTHLAPPRSCWLGLVLLVTLVGCSEKTGESLKALAPPPLPALPQAEDGRPAGGQEKATPVFGRPVPREAIRVKLLGSKISLDAELFDPASDAAALGARLAKKGAVILEPDAESYLAQVVPLLELLDNLGIQTWLLHPAGQVAFELHLRDEAAFQAWLDEPRPGKVRVIQRADGFELSTNIGKLPGPDPNGPSVPTREGRLDIAMLQSGLLLLRERFKDANDSCLVPSFGMEIHKVALALSGYFQGPDDPIFAEQCLVYPRPRRNDAGP